MATTTDKLAEAEDALHQLVTTGGLVRIKHGAKEMEFAQQDEEKLRAYIAELRGRRVTTVRLNGSKGF
jgi:hypothetical protein